MPYHAYKEGKGFRIVHESWRDGARQRRTVPRAEWPGMGLEPDKGLEAAREALKHLNSLEHEERGRQRAVKRLEADAEADYLYLPKALVRDFEKEVFTDSDRNHKPAHWAAAKKLIRAMGLPPKDWKFKRKLFYQWLREKPRCYSPDYSTDILRMVNMWGEYLCYRTNSFWSPIPPPSGPEMVAIRRRYFEKSKGGRDSARLSLATLEEKGGELPEAEHNWLYVSVAFGLRPEEIDRALSDEQYHRIEGETLKIFQFKLERLGYPWKQCWKAVTVELPHQLAALELLKRGAPLKRPGRKRLKKWFGKRMGYYGGRKEFAPYMRKQGFSAYQVMRWMGHQDLQTLRKNYDKADSDAPEDEAA
jgi:hypothetical protein